MTQGVSFTEIVSRNSGASVQALEIGKTFSQYIPQPSAERGLLDAALWWAAYVGKVVPLWHATDDRAKEARSDLLGVGWSSDDVASSDLRVVQDWWTAEKFSNIGFVSRGNGILILDLDPRHGGVDKWRALCGRYSIDDSAVPRSVSPRGDGGQHLWFRLPDGETFTHSPLMRGIDRPWQVPVPPSMRVVEVDKNAKDPSRRLGLRPYTWLAGDPRALPLAPPVLYGDQLETTQTTSAGTSGTDEPLPVDELVEGGVPVGQQSYTFKRLACSMIRKKYSDEQIIDELLKAAQHSEQDEADPWRRVHFEGMVSAARRYIERSDAEVNARNRALAAQITRRAR